MFNEKISQELINFWLVVFLFKSQRDLLMEQIRSLRKDFDDSNSNVSSTKQMESWQINSDDSIKVKISTKEEVSTKITPYVNISLKKRTVLKFKFN